MTSSTSIAGLQDKKVKTERCENHCPNAATHIDTRTNQRLCQPHSFVIRRAFRKVIQNV